EAYKGLNVAFGKFEQQVRSVTNFFRAGVVATAARQLVSAMNDVARTAVNLHHMSQELGFSEQQLRGFSRAAERVGVPGSQMLQGLTNFAHAVDDVKLRVGDVRERMVAMGAGDVVGRIEAARNKTEALRVVYQRIQELLKINPAVARKFAEDWGLG